MLDTATIDLCLSVLPWEPFRRTKTAAKLHTPLELRSDIPVFIHISDGKTLGPAVNIAGDSVFKKLRHAGSLQ